MSSKRVTVDIEELRGLSEKAVCANGFAPDDARLIVDVLLYAELRDNNQGLTKIAEGVVAVVPDEALPEVTSRRGGIVRIDAKWRNGALALIDAAHQAAGLARDHGIACVGVHNTSGSSGAIGYYARQMAKDGVIGLVCCGTPKAVAPAGGVDPVLGTNPIAAGIPRRDREPLVFDMSTAAIAWFGLIAARNQGEPIGEGLAYDGDGQPTTDPSAALSGAIKAFGGHKGSGLALIIEILAGPLIGGGIYGDDDANANRGNLVIAIDPAAFDESAFRGRVEALIAGIKSSRAQDGASDILLPGERGDRLMAERLQRGSIEIDARLLQDIRKQAGGAT